MDALGFWPKVVLACLICILKFMCYTLLIYFLLALRPLIFTGFDALRSDFIIALE